MTVMEIWAWDEGDMMEVLGLMGMGLGVAGITEVMLMMGMGIGMGMGDGIVLMVVMVVVGMVMIGLVLTGIVMVVEKQLMTPRPGELTPRFHTKDMQASSRD